MSHYSTAVIILHYTGKELKELQIQLDASKQINKMASEEIQALTQKNNHQLQIFEDQEEELSDLHFRNSDLEYSLSEQQHIIDDLRDEITINTKPYNIKWKKMKIYMKQMLI